MARLMRRPWRAALSHEPSLDLTVKSDASQWASRLHGEVLPTGTVRTLLHGSVTMLPGFSDGQWWVQDAAAALPARLFGDINGKAIADLCAAPGGKTAQLAQAGARVTAVDRSPARMTRLHDNLARLSLEAEVVVADAVEWPGARKVLTASSSTRPARPPALSAGIPTWRGCGRRATSPRW